MAIFGWFALGLLLVGVSGGCFFIALNLLGKYNIGGVANSMADRIFAICCILAVIFAWYGLLTHAPFTVSIN